MKMSTKVNIVFPNKKQRPNDTPSERYPQDLVDSLP